MLAYTFDFLLGAHSLRGWSHVCRDLLALRLACPRLKEAVAAANAFPRLEAALVAHG